MISVLIYIESRFPAERKKIKEFVSDYLSTRLSGNIEVGINIVGDRKMKELNTRYRKLPETTDVLSFPIDDPHSPSRADLQAGFSPDKSAPDKVLRLGDVIVSYPQAVYEAAEGNSLVDEKIQFLIAHGLDHLMGIHHD
ncbi:rRNA maturation RNase YbeY [Candidatus Microgenomates bacterium]|nr:MAG: rRNA maturation RNase YbeY [Candidatus Microgenomates bacterium]